MSSFSIALSGLTADSAALDVVGNNLANLNTTGYKNSNVSFYDLLQQSVAGGSTQIGGGVSAPQTERIFNQGSIQTHRRKLRRGDQGQRILRGARPIREHFVYARWKFQPRCQRQSHHRDGPVCARLVGAERRCQHQRPDRTITIPSNALQTPSATQNFSLSVNLNAAGVVGQPSGSFSTPIQVVDSLGVQHTLTVNFTETAPGNWNYEVDIPGADLAAGTPGTPSPVATGTLTFDSNGNLTSPAAPAQVPIAITGSSRYAPAT